MASPILYRSPSAGDYLNRWKRVVHLDRRLRDGSCPSAKILAGECGVGPKTIYRDIEALRIEMGAPIECVPGKGGYRYSEPGFAIPAAHLTERELFALMVAENAIAQYEGTPLVGYLRAAFDKILAALPGEARSAHERARRAVYFSGLPPIRVAPEVWTTLATCVESCRRAEIAYYLPASGEVTHRIIDPHLLVVRDREWFLVARTQRHRNLAIFYLPRVREVRRLEQRFEREHDFSPEAYYADGFNAMHSSNCAQSIALRFLPKSAHYAEEREWAVGQRLVRHRDGSITIHFRSGALFEIARQILRFGGAVEVLAPPSLRSDVLSAAQSLVTLHGAERTQIGLDTAHDRRMAPSVQRASSRRTGRRARA